MLHARLPPVLAPRIVSAWIGLVVALQAPGAPARVWRVTPQHDGDAPTIAAAIDSATAGDVVLLAPGTYTWTSEGASLPSMIRLRPGITVGSEGGAAATVLDGEYAGRILEGVDIGSDVVIEDLTFRFGFAPPERARTVAAGSATAWVAAPDDARGGAMEFRGASSPLVRRCVFVDNHASGGNASGGAVSCDDAAFEDCEFTGNRAAVAGSTDGRGGAISCRNARIERCTFRGNRAWGFEAASGGAVGCVSSTLRDCVFEDNLADCPGGPRGGAISALGTTHVERCVFRRNRVEAHYFHANGGAIDIQFGSIRDCTFIANAAECWTGPGRGGAVFATILDLSGSVFVANRAQRTDPLGPGQGGAVHVRFDLEAELCTLAGNSGGTSDGVGGVWVDELAMLHGLLVTGTGPGAVCNGTATWSCSDLFDNTQGDGICGTDGGSNFSSDPFYCSDPLATGDVKVRAGSPCLGRGPCARTGAGDLGCTASAVVARSWTAVKHLFR